MAATVRRPRRATSVRILSAAEDGRLPDRAIRAGIDLRLRAKVAHESRGGPEATNERIRGLLAERAAGPVTTHVADANKQHYEVPSPFFQKILGPNLRYSSCYWPDGVTDLGAAEEAALNQTMERARLADGDTILELGAGWGSLSLAMAARFPNSLVTTVSNSRTQKLHIDGEAQRRGLGNLTVITADIGEFEPPEPGTYDRVVSVEMFEHVRNHRELLRRVSSWLKPEGTCFVHVFAHREVMWHFDDEDPNDWLAQWFFSGGTMPSADLLLREQRDMAVVDHWWLNGNHYAKTLQGWLDRLDADPEGAKQLLATGDDPTPVDRQLSRWRLFLLASIGTWSFRGGSEFGVGHYLFQNRPLVS